MQVTVVHNVSPFTKIAVLKCFLEILQLYNACHLYVRQKKSNACNSCIQLKNCIER